MENRENARSREEMMEDLFQNPFGEMLDALGCLDMPKEVEQAMTEYLSTLRKKKTGEVSSEELHQTMQPMINEAIEQGNPRAGIALLNLHRYLSGEYRGYKINSPKEREASSDVARALPDNDPQNPEMNLVIPEGAILISGRFAARNLPEIMKRVEDRERMDDLVVRSPRFMLAAQVFEMRLEADKQKAQRLESGETEPSDAEKRYEEFHTKLSGLSEEQLKIADVADESQIPLPDQIGLAFIPRELAIDADAAQAGSESEASDIYAGKAQDIKSRVTPGGTVFAFTAASENFGEFEASINSKGVVGLPSTWTYRKNAETGEEEGTAMGFINSFKADGWYSITDRTSAPMTDESHAKMIKQFHVQKPWQ